MLQLLKSTPTTLCDRISRRDWLRVGGLGILGLNLPGMLMCEHLPHIARQAHHVTVIRSAHHNVGHAHCAASYFVLTGEDRGDSVDAFGARPIDYPGIGAVLWRLRPAERPVVP